MDGLKIVAQNGAAADARSERLNVGQAPVIFDTADSPACTECGSIMVRNGSPATSASTAEQHLVALEEAIAMRKSVHRSASTGRFVTASTAARHPGRTVRQSVPSHSTGQYRSAITGKYLSKASAARHPGNSVREG